MKFRNFFSNLVMGLLLKTRKKPPHLSAKTKKNKKKKKKKLGWGWGEETPLKSLNTPLGHKFRITLLDIITLNKNNISYLLPSYNYQ